MGNKISPLSYHHKFQGIYDLCRAICHPIVHSIDWSTCYVKQFRLAMRRKKLNGLSGWLCNNSENLPFKTSHNFFDHLNTRLFLPMLSVICSSSEDFLLHTFLQINLYAYLSQPLQFLQMRLVYQLLYFSLIILYSCNWSV